MNKKISVTESGYGESSKYMSLEAITVEEWGDIVEILRVIEKIEPDKFDIVPGDLLRQASNALTHKQLLLNL